jgi:hypothetical protein
MRLLLWPAFGGDYAARVTRRLQSHPLGEEVRAGKYRAVVLTEAVPPNAPPWIEFVLPVPPETPPALAAHLCKISAPTMFAESDSSVMMDADLTFSPELCVKLPLLFQAAEAFGFVVTQHPGGNWRDEPLDATQRADYWPRPGMIELAPLYMLGVIARAHSHPSCKTLTAAWRAEWDKHPTREQPTFAAAVWACGVAPVACPMSLLAWPGKIAMVNGRVPLFRHSP